MAKATTHPTCTPTNLNISARFSTLYANGPILLASILLNFRRRPESHLQLQVSEKLQEFRMQIFVAGRAEIFIAWRPINQHQAPGKLPSHSATPELLQLL